VNIKYRTFARNTIIAELKAKRFDKSCQRTGSVEEESRIENVRRETENRERLAGIPLVENQLRELKASLDQLGKEYKRLSREALRQERKVYLRHELRGTRKFPISKIRNTAKNLT